MSKIIAVYNIKLTVRELPAEARYTETPDGEKVPLPAYVAPKFDNDQIGQAAASAVGSLYGQAGGTVTVNVTDIERTDS